MREATACKAKHLYNLHRFDWTRPFKTPWSRRSLDALKNKYVIRLCVGIDSVPTRNLNYILVHTEGLEHGVNMMITSLYFCFRADMIAHGHPCFSAIHLFAEMDGGPENTGAAMMGFFSWLVSIGWYPGSNFSASDFGAIESHRNVTKHGHGGHDQLFYTMRYKGYYSAASVTSIAQAICLLKHGYKNTTKKVQILVFGKNWDWEKLFKRHINKFLKWTARPLAWRYYTSTDDDPRAMTQYRDWGDADSAWLGDILCFSFCYPNAFVLHHLDFIFLSLIIR